MPASVLAHITQNAHSTPLPLINQTATLSIYIAAYWGPSVHRSRSLEPHDEEPGNLRPPKKKENEEGNWG